MRSARVKKLRDAGSLLAISLVAVSIAGLALTGVLSALEQITWAVGLFITLKLFAAVLFGGILGLAIGLLIGYKKIVLLALIALLLIASIMFVHVRVSDLLSVHTPAMSGFVAPVAESLRDIGFLVGLMLGIYHFIRGRGKGD